MKEPHGVGDFARVDPPLDERVIDNGSLDIGFWRAPGPGLLVGSGGAYAVGPVYISAVMIAHKENRIFVKRTEETLAGEIRKPSLAEGRRMIDAKNIDLALKRVILDSTQVSRIEA